MQISYFEVIRCNLTSFVWGYCPLYKSFLVSLSAMNKRYKRNCTFPYRKYLIFFPLCIIIQIVKLTFFCYYKKSTLFL